MKPHSTIAPENSGAFSSLFLKYIKGDAVLKPLYQYEMSHAGILQFTDKQKYQDLNREGLVSELLKQNQDSLYFSNTQKINIEALNSKNTYTITTGHQLCLFTGPLYFIYKIITIINLAEKLNASQSEKKFVPVYWMATEDHDFNEINHLHLHDSTIRWKRDAQGAVGELDMQGIDEVIHNLKSALGQSDNAKKWIEIVSECYIGAKDFATATRNFVNYLFAEYGVIVLDANKAYFKNQFKSVLQQDIFNHQTITTYQTTLKYFGENKIDAQVLVRDINCFYLDKNIRARIEKQGDEFIVVDTKIKFSTAEMEEIFEQQIQKISPNVILRPLYQQTILPNAAYIGGPSENDYWLQLKAIFNYYQTAFPVLMPRQFALLIDEKASGLLSDMRMDVQDVLLKDDALIKMYLQKSEKAYSLEKHRHDFSEAYQKIISNIKRVDPTLEASAKAEFKRLVNGLEKLTKKANKAIKRKEDIAIQRLLKMKEQLMPSGSLQERHDNVMMYNIAPFASNMKDLIENLDAKVGDISVVKI
jgi:bacillithiol synthase